MVTGGGGQASFFAAAVRFPPADGKSTGTYTSWRKGRRWHDTSIEKRAERTLGRSRRPPHHDRRAAHTETGSG